MASSLAYLPNPVSKHVYIHNSFIFKTTVKGRHVIQVRRIEKKNKAVGNYLAET